MAGLSFVVLVACLALGSAQPVNNAPVLKDQPTEVLFKDNEQAVIECIVEGGQNVKYSWIKNGKAFTGEQRKGEGSIVFKKPLKSDEGQYQCFAESDAGIASSRIITFKRVYLNAQKAAPKDVTPLEGRTLKLECAIPDGYPKPTISWKARNGGKMEEFLSQRITISPEGDLYFSNVTQEDLTRGKYVCLANSPALNKEVELAEYTLKAFGKDSKPVDNEMVPQYLSGDMIAKAGDVTTIYCIYGGSPLAHPDWFKDGKDANGDRDTRVTRYNRSAGKRLLIKETHLEDQGTYTCTVDNEIGKPQKHAMKLTVVSAPKYAQKPEKQVAAKEGQDITIPCKVTGLPAPKVTWTYNAKPLSNPRATVNENGLVLKGVQKTDKGYYGCGALNEHGNEYAETLLQVV